MIYDKSIAFSKKVTTLTDHFSLEEFVCRCGTCQIQKLDLMLPLMLEDLRKHIGNRSIRINSGYRCSMWNKSQGGASNSQHLEGKAVDIYVLNMDPMDLAAACYNVGFRCIGVSDGFIHVDVRDLNEDTPYKIWTYANVDLIKVKRKLGIK